jgi:hypothetical protein
MATKPKPKPTEVVVVSPKAIGNWRDVLKDSVAHQKQEAAKMPTLGGNFISFRGGVISRGGQQLENPLRVVLLAVQGERAYYSTDWQPDSVASPDCFSFDKISPHEAAEIPQDSGRGCAGCRLNEFNSAKTGGGKACKEIGVMMMIHADFLKSAGAVAAAEIMQAKASVLNAKMLNNYVGALGDSPLCTVVTAIRNQPDSKSQYKLTFEPEEYRPNDAIMAALAVRVLEAQKLLATPPVKVEKPAGKAAHPGLRKGRKF